ncbi:MAG: DUF2783 domain-containing protein [Pseudomonadota bacterium]
MRLEDSLGPAADAFYEALLKAHAGLSEAESHALNARLVLMLANEVGALDRLAAILEEARSISDEDV